MPDLLLLHGALGAKTQFAPLLKALPENDTIHTLDFSGHGQAALRNTFGIEQFANEVIDYLDQQQLSNINIFGHSMGGYVGLYLAKHQAQRVNKLFTLGTKLNWTPAFAKQEAQKLNANIIEAKVPRFAAMLNARHTAQPWQNLVQQTHDMMLQMGQQAPLTLNDAKELQQTIRIGLGDRDDMVGYEECIEFYQQLPNGELQVLPGTYHPLEKMDVKQLAQTISNFFNP